MRLQRSSVRVLPRRPTTNSIIPPRLPQRYVIDVINILRLHSNNGWITIYDACRYGSAEVAPSTVDSNFLLC